MTAWAILFLVLFLVTGMTLLAVSIFAMGYARSLMSIEDKLDESLDILDKSYKEIGIVLEKPVFYDSPEIKRVITALKHSQHAILRIANKITEFRDEEENDDDREETT